MQILLRKSCNFDLDMIPSCQNLEGVLVAKTVNQGFQELRQRLEITDLQATDMAERQQRVREAVKKGLLVVDDFLTGSYMRNTMIAPLKEADIDIFIVLDGSLFDEYKPASLLLTFRLFKAKGSPGLPETAQ